ncbi:MAG: hypothetical protein ACQESC_02555 [Nanobdellota archaeon]
MMGKDESSSEDKYEMLKKEVDEHKKHIDNLQWDVLGAFHNTYKNTLSGDINNIEDNNKEFMDSLYENLHDILKSKGIDFSGSSLPKHTLRNAIDAILPTDHSQIYDDIVTHGPNYGPQNITQTLASGKMQKLQKSSSAIAKDNGIAEDDIDKIVDTYNIKGVVDEGYELNKDLLKTDIHGLIGAASAGLTDRYLQQNYGQKYQVRKKEE